MTLKEELEILRGEPIEVVTGDPMDIPCIETSDPEKLCKHPVVSVHMITYNHEPYIRQAIEGVMMQKTDFEFELVIGEDASTDKTREICFEYQKKYPDRIRVLWWHENLYRNPHPAGGNGARTRVHCRGEFIALCEGDDYWIDPLKLQKQMEVMRRYPTVGLCCGCYLHYDFPCNHLESRPDLHWPTNVVIPRVKAFLWMLFGMNPLVSKEQMIHTSTVLMRRTVLQRALKKYTDLFSLRFKLGDLQLWLGLTAESDLYVVRDPVSIYRAGAGGVTTGRLSASGVRRDGMLTAIYFAKKVLGLDYTDIPSFIMDDLFTRVCYIRSEAGRDAAEYLASLRRIEGISGVLGRRRYHKVTWASCKRGRVDALKDAKLMFKMEYVYGKRMSLPLSDYYRRTAYEEFQKEAGVNHSFVSRLNSFALKTYHFIKHIRMDDCHL